jgi:hypothetical protein
LHRNPGVRVAIEVAGVVGVQVGQHDLVDLVDLVSRDAQLSESFDGRGEIEPCVALSAVSRVKPESMTMTRPSGRATQV